MSNQVLLMLLLSAPAELAPDGHGAMLSSLEERNTAAARMCQARPLVKPKLATLILVMAELYAATGQSQLSFYCLKIYC